MGDPAPMNQIFTRVRRGTEQSQGIPTVGKAGLGLNKKEANWLFDGDLSRDEVLSGLACIREGDTFKMAEVIKTSREANYSLGCNDYDD
jgi:hypothetical protein